MLNRTGIKKETYVSNNQILFSVEHQVSMGVVVSKDLGVDVAGTNKKVVKAGTPITGNLSKRDTAFTAGTDDAVGVLLHDVDVTVGDNNGTILIFGFVNTNMLDADTKALITEDVEKALPMIKFVAC
jgi:hypothetical protein